MSEALGTMHLSNHLADLKGRLIRIFAAILLGFIISYIFIEEIYNWLLLPLNEAFGVAENNRKLIFTGLAEFFFTYLRLSMYSAVIITMPITLYNVYYFIAPGLYKKEKYALVFLITAAVMLFFAGVSLAYSYVIPSAWKFFLSFEKTGADGLQFMLEARVSEYLDIVITFMLAFGIAFQIPVILIVLVYSQIIKLENLIMCRKYAVVLAFVLGAILTPPDIFSQIALAIPMIILYEGTIIFIKIFMRQR